MTCIKCGKPSMYFAPESLCTHHWCQWWTDGLLADDKGNVDRKTQQYRVWFRRTKLVARRTRLAILKREKKARKAVEALDGKA